MPCLGCTAVDIEAGAINCESCEVIKTYFNRGYPYDAIVELLENDGIHLSLSTLKRRLKRLGLKRKGNVFDENQLKALITEEIQGPGRLSGYRAIWHALCLRHGPDWNVCNRRAEEIFTIFFGADIFKEYYILRVSPLYIEQQMGKITILSD